EPAPRARNRDRLRDVEPAVQLRLVERSKGDRRVRRQRGHAGSGLGSRTVPENVPRGAPRSAFKSARVDWEANGRTRSDRQARRQARETRLEMEDWADGILSTLEVNLEKFLTAVKRGRERLQERSQEAVVAGVSSDGGAGLEETSYS